jgi:hypothetical protein
MNDDKRLEEVVSSVFREHEQRRQQEARTALILVGISVGAALLSLLYRLWVEL